MKRILIAEDDKAIAKVLGLKLAKSGFEVTVVDNGEKALAEIAKNEQSSSSNRYDLILLDLLMPKMDGWTVLEKLKGSNLKIIVTSNLGQEEDIKKAKELGAIDFLVKSDTPLLNIVQIVNSYLA
jgi:CheY-like chemotaxis protein